MRDVVRYTYIDDDTRSSAIQCIWYDVFGRRMYVEFPNGTVAGYLNVPAAVVDEFSGADSMGQYFAKRVKSTFHGTSGDVDFVPFNADSDENIYPGYCPVDYSSRESEPVEAEALEDDGRGVYDISFVVESQAQFKAPAGDLIEALNLFVGSFAKDNNARVRVRSIKEVV